MKLTELLIIGYDADGPAVTTRRTPGQVAIVQTNPDAEGTHVVDDSSTQEAAAFTAICAVLDGLPAASAG